MGMVVSGESIQLTTMCSLMQMKWTADKGSVYATWSESSWLDMVIVMQHTAEQVAYMNR